MFLQFADCGDSDRHLPREVRVLGAINLSDPALTEVFRDGRALCRSWSEPQRKLSISMMSEVMAPPE